MFVIVELEWTPILSGASLVRPALDRLRDLVSVSAIDRIYVHSPDRLARNFAYQVLLLDEWQRRGIEVVFLDRPLGKSPARPLEPHGGRRWGRI